MEGLEIRGAKSEKRPGIVTEGVSLQANEIRLIHRASARGLAFHRGSPRTGTGKNGQFRKQNSSQELNLGPTCSTGIQAQLLSGRSPATPAPNRRHRVP